MWRAKNEIITNPLDPKTGSEYKQPLYYFGLIYTLLSLAQNYFTILALFNIHYPTKLFLPGEEDVVKIKSAIYLVEISAILIGHVGLIFSKRWGRYLLSIFLILLLITNRLSVWEIGLIIIYLVWIMLRKIEITSGDSTIFQEQATSEK